MDYLMEELEKVKENGIEEMDLVDLVELVEGGDEVMELVKIYYGEEVVEDDGEKD